ncbi:unnamed protein product [Brassicogethes aeneus]|uniref:Uncharacterized protein n=1 Tax=Brassicogethes aeneus TaxID=1431903 RepID=A0A9P0AY00_BRAAE|nr:unnamed protein product [Brassicogethes aeneus]
MSVKNSKIKFELFLPLICLLMSTVFCQDCKMYGQICIDEKDCCGGCCDNNICIDTYRDCKIRDDPCLKTVCPEDMNCEIFQPEYCPGCDIQTVCVPAEPAPPLHHSLEDEEHFHHGSCESKKISFVFVYCFLFYFVYLVVS